MNTDSRTRIECTDWDEEVPVATWTKGCGRKPARKVITKGVAKVELTKAQTERIAKMLGSGMEVRLAVGGEEAIRSSPVRGGVLPCGGRRPPLYRGLSSTVPGFGFPCTAKSFLPRVRGGGKWLVGWLVSWLVGSWWLVKPAHQLLSRPTSQLTN